MLFKKRNKVFIFVIIFIKNKYISEGFKNAL